MIARYSLVKSLFPLLLACVSSHAHAFCWEQASQRYNVPVELLQAIAYEESQMNPRAININRKGTPEESVDIGLMQINTQHLKKLERFDISEEDLKNSPCTNLNVGAWILAHNFKVYGNNWRAIGAYNAGYDNTKRAEYKRLVYANKVFERIRKMKKKRA